MNKNEEVEILKNIRDNEVKDEKLKEVLNKIIEQKNEDETAYQVVERFIVQFEKDLKIKVKKEPILNNAPILTDLYYNFILNHYKPTATYKKAISIGDDIQQQIEKNFTLEQKVLVKELEYCITRRYEELSQQLFIYGYTLHSQLNNECETELKDIIMKNEN